MWRGAIVLAVTACSSHAAPTGFGKQFLDAEFRSEGVTAFDVDGDGHLDLVTDQYWYRGPSFSDAHEIRTPEVYDPAARYSLCSAAFGDDVDGDGLVDLIVAPFPTDAAYWYKNPGGGGHWTPYELAPPLGAGPETPIYVDLFGTGRRVLVVGIEPQLQLAWLAPGSDPTRDWIATPISGVNFPGANHFAHGLGAGDINGDGRLDILTSFGWFAQTADPAAWTFHAFDFGPLECSAMYAYDIDGDGLADVICPHPHDYGIHWWQQRADGTFAEQVIDDSISQLHAAVIADVDGDGRPDLVTGKTRYAHTYDPGAEDPSVLVYYTLPGLVRHDIDQDSGVGRQFIVEDLDGDRHPDVAVSNKNGLFVFRGR